MDLREKIFAYAKERYGTSPEYLWKRDPDSAVLRNGRNRKWYAIAMIVPRQRLGLDTGGMDPVDVINVKVDPDLLVQMIQADGFLPGYHMDKRYWMTILLDGSVGEGHILDLLDMSYGLVDER